MSTRDHARFAYLMLRRGNWNGRQIISQSWIEQATRPAGPGSRTDYGYLWWLAHTDMWPDAPRNSFAAVGDGPNVIWIDPEHDLVVVWRWFRGDPNEFFKRIVASLEPGRVPSTTSTGNEATALKVGENGVKIPVRLNKVVPVLPSGVEPRGTAVVEVLISPQGTVESVSVLRRVQPPEPALDQAFIDAARKWVFRPTVIDGVAYPVKLRVSINFANVPR